MNSIPSGTESPLSILTSSGDLLDAISKVAPDSPFATFYGPDPAVPEEIVSHGDFCVLARKFGALYRQSGVNPGDTVVLVMQQGVSLMAAFAGALWVGAVPAILAYPNFKLDPTKYRQGLMGVTSNLQACLIVLDEQFPASLEACFPPAADVHRLRVSGQRLRGTEPTIFRYRPRADEIAFIQHSAGTTGLQKGVPLSHRQVLRQLLKLARALGIEKSDRLASWLPLYHDMGLIAGFILPLATGIELILQSPVDWVLRPSSFLHLVTRHRCSLGWLPNFAFQFMARRCRDDEMEQLNLSSLRALINCSEPIRWSSLEEFRSRFRSRGLPQGVLQTCYALAENVFAVTLSQLGREPTLVRVDREELEQGRVCPVDPSHPSGVTLVSSGHLLPSTQVRIVDEESQGAGQVGEIRIESDCLFSGYRNRPQLTSKVLQNGVYRTGDLGFELDRELFVLGRCDDVIIIGGRNLHPHEVEEVVFDHVLIHDGRAVAFGVDNPELGTQDLVVVAETESQSGPTRRSLEAELRRAIRSATGVTAREIQLVPPGWLVKSSAGKPARSTNRDKYLSQKSTIRSRVP